MASALAGRVIAVTGAASGIGAATVQVLRAKGAKVAGLDRAWPAGAESRPADHLTLTLDVTDTNATTAAFAKVHAHFGRLDGLATCAGIVDTTPFMELDAARFAHVLAVNVTGSFLSMQAAARHMQSGARMVTVASIAGMRGGGVLGTAAYSASKGAVLGLTKNAARVFGPLGIAVNTVAPGFTETPMTAPVRAVPGRAEQVVQMAALGRGASPTEIAEAIAWLLSPEASYVHGATLVADGGIVMA